MMQELGEQQNLSSLRRQSFIMMHIMTILCFPNDAILPLVLNTVYRTDVRGGLTLIDISLPLWRRTFRASQLQECYKPTNREQAQPTLLQPWLPP
jgi:hypothetical protein